MCYKMGELSNNFSTSLLRRVPEGGCGGGEVSPLTIVPSINRRAGRGNS